jgi:hypothetical protein
MSKNPVFEPSVAEKRYITPKGIRYKYVFYQVDKELNSFVGELVWICPDSNSSLLSCFDVNLEFIGFADCESSFEHVIKSLK